MKVLCCGEALIDMIPSGDDFRPLPGGAVFNTAIALGRLGVATGMLTGLSRDLFGRRLAAALAESGVDTGPVVLSDRPTTLAFVTLRDGQAEYVFYDEHSAGRMLSPEDVPALPEAEALFFGGISLAVEPGADTYAGLLRQAGDRLVMIDPNIRPGFIADRAVYVARIERMLARADIVKVSDADLDWLYPGEALAGQVARIQALGAGAVIATRGSEGAVCRLAGGAEVSVPAERVAVVDTVGAGDTFNAGVLASLSEQGLLTRSAVRGLGVEKMRTAMAFGARVAAVTVSRAGANPPWRAEV